MTTGFALPFAVRSTIDYHTGLRHVLLLLSTPVDDVTSTFTFVVWRNDDFSVSAEEIIRFDLAIGAEDRAMLERIPGRTVPREERRRMVREEVMSTRARVEKDKLIDGLRPGVAINRDVDALLALVPVER